MQEAQTQRETKDKCCGKSDRNRTQRRGKCSSSHKHEANAATANPLEVLRQRFARGEIDPAEFKEKRRVITNTTSRHQITDGEAAGGESKELSPSAEF